MRNPRRKAILFAALSLAGAALLWLGVWWESALGRGGISGVMTALGLVTLVCSTLFLLLKVLPTAIGRARLLAGVGRIARWRTSAADWDRFRALDAERAVADPMFLASDLWIRRQTPPEGVEIIVGEKALIVDGSYHSLRLNGIPELRSIGWLDNAARPGRPPDCLEFLLAYPAGRYGGVRYTCLRVPVPEAARAQGLSAYRHFAPALEKKRGRGAIALRNPRRTYQITATLFGLGLVATVAGAVMIAIAHGRGEYAGMIAGFLTLGGSFVAIPSALVGGMTFLLQWREGKESQRRVTRK